MSDKETYCKTLEDCLEKWTKRIVELETASDIAEGPARADCCKQIDALKSIGGQMKAIFSTGGDGDNPHPCHSGKAVVVGVKGFGDNHFIIWVHRGHHGKDDGFAASGGHIDLLPRNSNACTLIVAHKRIEIIGFTL